MTRTLLLRVSLVILATSTAYGRADDLPYAQVSRVPRVVNSGSLFDFEFDPTGSRLYALSIKGVHWVDVRASEPRVNGPIPFNRLGTIAIAPDLGRLYFSKDREQFGYVNLRTNETTILTGKEWRCGEKLVYEPTRKELYATTTFRGDVVAVYDSETGRRKAEIKLPGYQVGTFESVAGKVFVTLANKPELFAIDAASHAVAPWLVNGRTIISPGRVQVDPVGDYVLIQHNRGVIAVDARTATVAGSITTPLDSSTFAFDPEKRILVVPTVEVPDHPRIRLHAYAFNVAGFRPIGELPNLENEGGRVYSMHGGFIQEGHSSLLLWLAPESKR
jgi:hypothetical protein